MTDTIAKLQTQGLDISRTAKLVSFTDDASLKLASEWLKLTNDYILAVKGFCNPVCHATDAAHKAAVKQRDDLLAPGLVAQTWLKNEVGRYQLRQATLRRQAEDKARREAEERRREAEQAQLKKAEEALTAGATAQAAKLVQEPVPLVVTRIEMPAPTKVAGITTREHWSAEVVDFLMLIQAVASNQQRTSPDLLQPNVVELNRLARLHKTDLQIPGVRAVRSANVAVQA